VLTQRCRENQHKAKSIYNVDPLLDNKGVDGYLYRATPFGAIVNPKQSTYLAPVVLLFNYLNFALKQLNNACFSFIRKQARKP
jgi:hypothetical protein